MNNKSTPPSSAPKKPAPPPPKWWSPSIGVWFVVGFAALAAVPYLTSATKLMAEGKELSPEAVKKEMKAKQGEKKKEDMKKEDPAKLREIKGLAIAADGTVYGGGKAGLFALKDGEWSAIEGFKGHDVKAIALAANGEVLVAHHDGVSSLANGQWSDVYDGEVHNVASAGDAVYLAAHKPAALLKRQADGSWAKINDGLPLPAGGAVEHPKKTEKEPKAKESDD